MTGADPLVEIEQVLSIRKPLYEQAADIMIDTSEIGIEAVVEQVIDRL